MSTSLVMAYAGGLEVLHRARPGSCGGAAIDLACGPGHYTLCLARYFDFDEIVGFDLAPGMIETASANAREQELGGRVRFELTDITRLEGRETNSVALSSFTDAAHHMADLGTVTHVVEEMDRITQPEGLVMLMDLVRLKTASLTEGYVQALSADYVERGLTHFLEDFRNSLYAAWTVAEMRQAVPRRTDRTWFHVVSRGLPTVQFVLGLPVGRRRLYLRRGLPWGPEENPVPPELRMRWRLLRPSLTMGRRRCIRQPS
jgi:ubiquinone/menaquinone biosynthesis C-methylase UbiE